MLFQSFQKRFYSNIFRFSKFEKNVFQNELKKRKKDGEKENSNQIENKLN